MDSTSTFRLAANCIPVALYTYETAHAQSAIFKVKHSLESYEVINNIVKSYFGEKHVDNKITIECEVLVDKADHQSKQLIYITYWDGIVTVGLTVRFDRDFIKPHNQHRKVIARHLIQDHAD